jgi:hypothetical protein
MDDHATAALSNACLFTKLFAHVCLLACVCVAHIPHDGRAYTTSSTESQDGNWAGCRNGCSELIPQSPM